MSTSPPQQSAPSAVPVNVAEDKTAAIVSYLTLLGFIAAVVIHSGKKTQIGAFHLRQTLGLFLTGLVLGIVSAILGRIPFLGWLITLGLYLAFFVFWLLGLVAAVNGQQKPIPVIGEHYQKWFATAFT
ncbi:MAG TPA: DUF4870 domain-containing protein [Polyangiales bacterium]|nr:DUF4870 domain-containing protein [Polyangiales bacterium]